MIRDTRQPAEYWRTNLQRLAEYLEEDRADSFDMSLPRSDRHRFMNLFERNMHKYVLALYSSGAPVQEVARQARYVSVELYPRYVAEFPYQTPVFDCATRPGFDNMHRLFAMLILSASDINDAALFLPSIEAWIEPGRDDSFDRDRIWHAYRARMRVPDASTPDRVLWVGAYAKLWLSIDPDEPDFARPKHMKDFLDGWYRAMASEMAAFTETLGPNVTEGSYVGYWCLEAAAAAILFQIDDTTFADHPYYPKDWANWARQNTPWHR